MKTKELNKIMNKCKCVCPKCNSILTYRIVKGVNDNGKYICEICSHTFIINDGN